MNISLGCQFVQSSSLELLREEKKKQKVDAANWRLSDNMLAILDSSPIPGKQAYLDDYSWNLDQVQVDMWLKREIDRNEGGAVLLLFRLDVLLSAFEKNRCKTGKKITEMR